MSKNVHGAGSIAIGRIGDSSTSSASDTDAITIARINLMKMELKAGYLELVEIMLMLELHK